MTFKTTLQIPEYAFQLASTPFKGNLINEQGRTYTVEVSESRYERADNSEDDLGYVSEFSDSEHNGDE